MLVKVTMFAFAVVFEVVVVVFEVVVVLEVAFEAVVVFDVVVCEVVVFEVVLWVVALFCVLFGPQLKIQPALASQKAEVVPHCPDLAHCEYKLVEVNKMGNLENYNTHALV